MDDTAAKFEIQREIMAAKNKLRFMKNPVEPERIVGVVEGCFQKLTVHLVKIKDREMRREFRQRCKSVAVTTDQSITEAVDGNWKCDLQAVLDQFDTIVDLILPTEAPAPRVPARPVMDEMGFVDGPTQSAAPSYVEAVKRNITHDTFNKTEMPHQNTIPKPKAATPQPYDPDKSFGYVNNEALEVETITSNRGYINQTAELQPSGSNGYIQRAPRGRRIN
jgi:hypothetical protein